MMCMIFSLLLVALPIKKFSGFTSRYIKCLVWTYSMRCNCNRWTSIKRLKLQTLELITRITFPFGIVINLYVHTNWVLLLYTILLLEIHLKIYTETIKLQRIEAIVPISSVLSILVHWWFNLMLLTASTCRVMQHWKPFNCSHKVILSIMFCSRNL